MNILKCMHDDIIELDLEEQNELLFKVQVEGHDSAPTKVRLVCESNSVAYMFNGSASDMPGIVQFNLPNMKGKLSEGKYDARIEVLVDNKYFVPIQFQLGFKAPIKVVAESVTRVVQKKQPEISVSVEPIVVKKQEPVTVVSENKVSVRSSALRDRYLKRREKQ